MIIPNDDWLDAPLGLPERELAAELIRTTSQLRLDRDPIRRARLGEYLELLAFSLAKAMRGA